MYSTGSRSSISAAIGDINNDYRSDIVTVNYDANSIDVLLGYDESFPGQITHPTGRYPESTIVCDLNNDTRLDIVDTNEYENTLNIHLGHGNGFFAERMKFPIGRGPHSLAFGDFDNDGDIDLILVNHEAEVQLLSNLRQGQFVDHTSESGINLSEGKSRLISFK